MYLPPITFIATSFRQLKNRLYDNDMEFISQTLLSIVVEHHPWLLYDGTVDMKYQSNQLIPLLYFTMYNEVEKKEQVPLHKSNPYKKIGGEGVFDLSRNSQKPNTPTIASKDSNK